MLEHRIKPIIYLAKDGKGAKATQIIFFGDLKHKLFISGTRSQFRKLLSKTDCHRKALLRQRLLADFVAMCCLVGNDFLWVTQAAVDESPALIFPIYQHLVPFYQLKGIDANFPVATWGHIWQHWTSMTGVSTSFWPLTTRCIQRRMGDSVIYCVTVPLSGLMFWSCDRNVLHPAVSWLRNHQILMLMNLAQVWQMEWQLCIFSTWGSFGWRYLTKEDLTLDLPRWSGLLEQVAQESQEWVQFSFQSPRFVSFGSLLNFGLQVMIPTFCWIHLSHLHPWCFFLQDECELLLDMVGLGLGPKQLPYRGPGPPPADWDGLSVAVWNVPRKATQQQIVAPWTRAVSP